MSEENMTEKEDEEGKDQRWANVNFSMILNEDGLAFHHAGKRPLHKFDGKATDRLAQAGIRISCKRFTKAEDEMILKNWQRFRRIRRAAVVVGKEEEEDDEILDEDFKFWLGIGAKRAGVTRNNWKISEADRRLCTAHLANGLWDRTGIAVSRRARKLCLGQYINPSIRGDAWSKEEDARLMELLSTHGPHGSVQLISEHMGRSQKSISKRIYTSKQNRKNDENKALIVAVIRWKCKNTLGKSDASTSASTSSSSSSFVITDELINDTFANLSADQIDWKEVAGLLDNLHGHKYYANRWICLKLSMPPSETADLSVIDDHYKRRAKRLQERESAVSGLYREQSMLQSVLRWLSVADILHLLKVIFTENSWRSRTDVDWHQVRTTYFHDMSSGGIEEDDTIVCKPFMKLWKKDLVKWSLAICSVSEKADNPNPDSGASPTDDQNLESVRENDKGNRRFRYYLDLKFLLDQMIHAEALRREQTYESSGHDGHGTDADCLNHSESPGETEENVKDKFYGRSLRKQLKKIHSHYAVNRTLTTIVEYLKHDMQINDEKRKKLKRQEREELSKIRKKLEQKSSIVTAEGQTNQNSSYKHGNSDDSVVLKHQDIELPSTSSNHSTSVPRPSLPNLFQYSYLKSVPVNLSSDDDQEQEKNDGKSVKKKFSLTISTKIHQSPDEDTLTHPSAHSEDRVPFKSLCRAPENLETGVESEAPETDESDEETASCDETENRQKCNEKDDSAGTINDTTIREPSNEAASLSSFSERPSCDQKTSNQVVAETQEGEFVHHQQEEEVGLTDADAETSTSQFWAENRNDDGNNNNTKQQSSLSLLPIVVGKTDACQVTEAVQNRQSLLESFKTDPIINDDSNQLTLDTSKDLFGEEEQTTPRAAAAAEVHISSESSDDANDVEDEPSSLCAAAAKGSVHNISSDENDEEETMEALEFEIDISSASERTFIEPGSSTSSFPRNIWPTNNATVPQNSFGNRKIKHPSSLPTEKLSESSFAQNISSCASQSSPPFSRRLSQPTPKKQCMEGKSSGEKEVSTKNKSGQFCFIKFLKSLGKKPGDLPKTTNTDTDHNSVTYVTDSIQPSKNSIHRKRTMSETGVPFISSTPLDTARRQRTYSSTLSSSVIYQQSQSESLKPNSGDGFTQTRRNPRSTTALKRSVTNEKTGSRTMNPPLSATKKRIRISSLNLSAINDDLGGAETPSLVSSTPSILHSPTKHQKRRRSFSENHSHRSPKKIRLSSLNPSLTLPHRKSDNVMRGLRNLRPAKTEKASNRNESLLERFEREY